MVPTQILDIAPEILIKILKNLHFIDILSCAQTCQTMSEIIRSSLELDYYKHLHVAGLLDNPRCYLPLSERLGRLKEREQRWNAFEYKTNSVYPVPHNTSNLFEISPSTIVMGIALDNGKPGTKGLQTAQLATLDTDQGDIPLAWKDFKSQADILEIGVAIEEHDLIACIVSIPDSEGLAQGSDILVFLRRYSSELWHDGCKEPILPICSLGGANGTPNFTIEISGENLAITMVFNGRNREDESTVEDSMFIYDWKLGKNKTPNGMPIISGGLAFLQENIIARPNCIRKSIDLYHVPSSNDLFSNSGSQVQLIRQLLLPETPFEWFMTTFEIRSTPNPASDSTCPEFISQDKPFTNDPSQAIIFFSIYFFNVETQDLKNFIVFTHRKNLLDLVPWKRADPVFIDDDRPFDHLDWEQWGPPATRWFSEDQFRSAQVTTTSGQRYAMTVYSTEKELPNRNATPKIQLINFSPWTVKMAQWGLLEGLEVVGGDRKDLDGEELAENRCPASEIFFVDVVGRLPYARTIKSVEWPHPAAMMNEDMLIGLILKPGTRHVEYVSAMYFG
ncbi:hypothetical protein BDN70DRAFT_876157 [Pholiota conissans]|uniref:F-box domain-containing protein n=1 Tax=Pholiota conissans TaxID=109636 RepID=A0A9P5Z7I1_9AGAR|nr:hypothetical protein BDN70DRAFT_876157 [Pholiota conissans]